MRIYLGGLAILALTACAPIIPDSGAGTTATELYRSAPPAAATSEATPAGQPPVMETDTNGPGQPAIPGAAGYQDSISDEQDFSAVAARETIESDAERIAANRARYQVVEPTELPQRPGENLSLVVRFALATDNPKGQPLYSRSMLFAKARFDRNCAKYPSSEEAQEAFLKRGGPQRDPMGLDPDGDGFACYWDPAPFRQALAARQTAPVTPAAPASE